MKIDFYDFHTYWGFEAIAKVKSLAIAWFTDSIVMSVLETVKDIFNEIDSLFLQLIQNVMEEIIRQSH